MRNSFNVYFGPEASPDGEGSHAAVNGHVAVSRGHLSYAAGSLSEGGMSDDEVERFVGTNLDGICREADSMQQLIDLGMDGNEARKYVLQQEAVDKGYEFHPESVDGLLFLDRQRTAQQLLGHVQEPPEIENHDILTMRVDDSPDALRDAVRAVIEHGQAKHATAEEVRATVNRAAEEVRSLPATG